MSTSLLILAMFPPICLMYMVYKQDKIEKEPASLILRLFVLGGFAIVPAALIESYVMNSILAAVFGSTHTILYRIVNNFICIALVEEGVKYIALRPSTWKSAEFNYRFDGIIYAVAVSLGFATAENIGYVAVFGTATAIARAVTSIPGHCIFGIFMGYYYGMAKYKESIGELGKKKFYMIMSLLMPVLLHGVYDFCAEIKGNAGLVFFVYVAVLDIIAFLSIKKYSSLDKRV